TADADACAVARHHRDDSATFGVRRSRLHQGGVAVISCLQDAPTATGWPAPTAARAAEPAADGEAFDVYGGPSDEDPVVETTGRIVAGDQELAAEPPPAAVRLCL